MQKLAVWGSLIILAVAWPVQSGLAGEKPIVGFCMGLQHSPLHMYKRYQPLMDYLSQHTPYRFELVLSRSAKETVHLFRKGAVQVAWLDEEVFPEIYEKIKATPILKPLNPQGQPLVRCAIIVSAASPLRTLRDLRGKKIAYGPPHSIETNLLPRALLTRTGIGNGGSDLARSYSTQEDIVKAVLWRSADAGAVTEQVAEKYARMGLRVLAYSDPVPPSPILISNDAPGALAMSIASALLAIATKPATTERNKAWDSSFRHGFQRAKPSDYLPLIRMFRSSYEGCGKQCHGGKGA